MLSFTCLEEVADPPDSLVKGLLLRPLLPRIVQVSAHAVAVRNTAEQVDLPRLARLDENLLRFVALLRRENGVRLCGRDGQRTLDLGEFLLLNERLEELSVWIGLCDGRIHTGCAP